ncbi:MAG: GNAT family N-acetyltransferase [Rickettsiales bacterium]|nr:GNAT family N-acetyltransferase [Rickettsiales bacterium]
MNKPFPPIQEVPYGGAEYQRMVDFREEWMRKPMRQVMLPEHLVDDAQSLHFRVEEDTRLIGCVLLLAESPTRVRLRQLVVHPDWRGRGLGAHLVQFFEHKAQALGFAEVVLSGRETAIPFYEKLGYHAVGDTYLSYGIPHKKMTKQWSGCHAQDSRTLSHGRPA